MNIIEYIKKQNSLTQTEWEDTFEQQEQTILVLRHEGGGGQKRNGFWVASACFLAYVDASTGFLHSDQGRLVYPVSDEEQQHGGCFGRFADETIYRLKVRAKKKTSIPEGISESFQSEFLVVEILEKNATCPALEDLLAEYRKPIILEDDTLGTLTLDKRFDCFEGSVLWNGTEVSISLEVDQGNKGSWTKARKAMKTLLAKQAAWDAEMRSFAANQLTALACEWRTAADEPTPEITKQSFKDRLTLQTISITAGGCFSAYFDDDDMFFGHCVTVQGSLKKGITSASMEG